MSEKYRLMIYFAVSTMFIYSKGVNCGGTMTVQSFLNNGVCNMKLREGADK